MRKNKKYIEYIRTLNCCICGNPSTEAHHIRDKTITPVALRGGTGLKPSDYFCVPLCRDCHTSDHMGSNELNHAQAIISSLIGYIEVLNGTE